MIHGALWLVAAVFGASSASADLLDRFPVETPETITVVPVDVSADRLDGLRLRHAHVWTGVQPIFGGFSGLEIDGNAMLALTDRSWLLVARLEDTPDGLRPLDAGYVKVRSPEARSLRMPAADSEGLALLPDGVAISFEAKPRVLRHLGEGRFGRPLTHASLAALPFRAGPEALAALPSGALLTLSEHRTPEGAVATVFHPDGTVDTATVSTPRGFNATGADVGPDGRLYVVLRRFRWYEGTAIRVLRYDLTARGLPDGETARDMAHLDGSGGFDNMEGLAVWTDASGGTRLTLIADDNFLFLQRTLVADFDVTG